ncbi:hypothetical protein HAALTHF_50850n [Vreelandella aquamarina]|nr:hypothetical protein HAALTHF_50850n [Halomonas axialensis]
MSLPIHWHDEAINDLFELVVYIAERDPQAARRLRIRIEAAVSSVAEHPTYTKWAACRVREKLLLTQTLSWSTK